MTTHCAGTALALLLLFGASAALAQETPRAGAAPQKYTDQRQHIVDLTTKNCEDLLRVDKPAVAADFQSAEAYERLGKRRMLKDIMCTCVPGHLDRFTGLPPGKNERAQALFKEVMTTCTIRALRELPYCEADQTALNNADPKRSCQCARKGMAEIGDDRLTVLLREGTGAGPNREVSRASFQDVVSHVFERCQAAKQ